MIQDTEQANKVVNNPNLEAYRDIIKRSGKFELLELFDQAIRGRTCLNVFQGCKVSLNKRQYLFHSNICKSKFHQEINSLKKILKNKDWNKEVKKKCVIFIEKNEDAWCAIQGWALKIANKKKRVRVRGLLERAKEYFDVTADNSISPLLARKLVELYPDELGDYIYLKQRKFE